MDGAGRNDEEDLPSYKDATTADNFAKIIFPEDFWEDVEVSGYGDDEKERSPKNDREEEEKDPPPPSFEAALHL